MAEPNRLTLENCALLLQRRGLISQEQLKDILLRGKAQESKLFASHQAGASRRVRHGAEIISPVEVITSFNLELSGSPGKFLTEDAITEVLASAVGMPYLKIDPLKLDLDVVTAHIPRPFALKNLIVAVAEDKGVITVAVADPFNDAMIKELAAAHRLEIRRVLSSKSDILKILREFYGFRASVDGGRERGSAARWTWGTWSSSSSSRGRHEIEASDEHIVNAVEFLLQHAFDQRASDIHIEPKRDKSPDPLPHRRRAARHPARCPSRSTPPIISRIKTCPAWTSPRSAARRTAGSRPSHDGKEIELRVSTLPIAFGEKMVMRIFDPDVLLQDLDGPRLLPETSCSPSTTSSTARTASSSSPAPPARGKTTTLYSALKTLSIARDQHHHHRGPDRDGRSRSSTRSAVQQGHRHHLRHVLRTILRQDPDIIMIGEIRDHETAQNAVQAALTGHLVFSTLHTNDAASAVTRLLDLGVPPFLISSTLIGIMAQRLVRKICIRCKRERELTNDERNYLQLGKSRA